MNIGRVVAGRYEVLERLGVGAVFAVYKGRDRSSGRQVAMKALLPETLGDVEFLRCLREAAPSLVDLDHANIAKVYELIEDQEGPILVTEFVRGINLKERIKRIAPFTLSVAVDFAVAICEALHHAHGAGVIHADVRPHNVIVSPDGAVKVTDFGLIRAYASSTEASSRHLGRAVHYQAPETATKGIYLPATDLYALGAIVFEMLTGSVPYPGESVVSVAMRHQNDPVPSPRRLNPGVPRALEGIVMRAMQKQPEHRYVSAGDMLADLRAVRDAFRFGRSLAWSPMDAGAPTDADAALRPAGRVGPTEPAGPQEQPLERPDRTAPQSGAAVVRSASAATAGRTESAREAQQPMPRQTYDDDRISPLLRFAIMALIVVILLGIVFGGALWMATYTRPESNTFPNLVGRPITEAQREANRLNIKLIQREEFNDRYDPGVVYRTDYEPGRPIRAGRSVLVWVSRGSRLVWVPDVVGATAEEAEAKLKEAGLVPGQVNRTYDDRAPYGTVVSQNPRSGKRVDRDTPVALVLSDGPENSGEETVEPTQDLDAEHTWTITHHVRRDGLGPRQVRIEYEDSQGSSTAFDEVRSEGDTVRVEVNGRGPTLIVRVYYSDDPIPVSERTQVWNPRR